MLADSASTPSNVNVSKIDLEQRDVVVGLINFCHVMQVESRTRKSWLLRSSQRQRVGNEAVTCTIPDFYRCISTVRRNRPGQARAPAEGRQSKAQRMEGDRHGQLSKSRPLFLCAARSAPRLAPPPNPLTHDAPRAMRFRSTASPLPAPSPVHFVPRVLLRKLSSALNWMEFQQCIGYEHRWLSLPCTLPH